MKSKKYTAIGLVLVATLAIFIMMFRESIFVKVATDKSPEPIAKLNTHP